MARHLLDTNILSYLVDTASPPHAAVRGRLSALADRDEAVISVLSLYELHHWFAYDPAHKAAAAELVRDFAVLPLPQNGAELFGALMRDLRTGFSRGDVQRHAVDCMIAVTAIEHGAVLVSNDSLFEYLATMIPALQIDDWIRG
jgi:predicted nucleic acid-binding protein